jgi:hypothetical protein
MMFERFDTQSGTVVVQAREEARLLGATRLEAEHLLLALARQGAWDAGRVLADAGLDHDGIGRALDAEVLRSLESVGVTQEPRRSRTDPCPRRESRAGAPRPSARSSALWRLPKPGGIAASIRRISCAACSVLRRAPCRELSPRRGWTGRP